MSSAPAEQLVWIDCEMTGLEVPEDSIVEIAVIVTDFDLNLLDPGFSIVINPGPEPIAHMGEFVTNMHRESGLLPLIEGGVTMSEAERQTIEYIDRFVPAGKRPLLAGNTIGMDRRFISEFMPALDERLHYRSIDVSTFKELARRWYPSTYFSAPDKDGGHRALADIAESIRELAYYRSAVMIEGSGPSSSEAKRLASAAVEKFA